MTSDRPGRSANWFPRHPIAEDVDREIRTHLTMRARELIDQGWDENAAFDEAVRLFGDREAVADECRRISNRHKRATRRAIMMAAIWQDLKYGVRILARSPGFTIVAVVTLALGIGANTAIFSVINGVLLSPLPFQEPEELVSIREINYRGGNMSVAWANFADWETEVTSLASMAAYGTSIITVLGADQPLSVTVASVSRGFWRVFPTTPYAGRLTNPADHVTGAEPVVVVSRRLWKGRLGQRALDDIRLELSGVRARVIGVAPEGFDHPGGAEIWAPVEPFGPSSTSRTAHNWDVEGRLAHGVTIEQARQEIDALTLVLVEGEPEADPEYLAIGASVVSLRRQVVGESRTMLFLLLGAAGLVLVVACTNLASTLLARGTNRAQEFAVRASLGAGRRRIVRQLLTESLLLAAAGGLAGIGLAAIVLRGLTAFGSPSVPRMNNVTMDGSVLLFSAVITFGTAFLFGLLPALRLMRQEPGESLRGGGRGNAVDHRSGIWRLLIGTEVAVALVLLVGSGLLIRSFQSLLSQNPGFDASDVATTPLSLSRIQYRSPADHERFHSELLQEIAALPGVSGAGVMSTLPVSGGVPNGRMEVDGDLSRPTNGAYVVVSGGVFQTLDVPLISGRRFDDRDGPDGEFVAIVSEQFARHNWPGQDPIGRQVTGGGMDNFWEERLFARVIGVVGDVPFRQLSEEPMPTVYFPHSQRPFRLQYNAQLVVESANGDPAAVMGGVRSTIARLDPDIPIQINTLEGMVRGSVSERQFTMSLLGGFSAIALVLAGVGIYGVMSFTVARRTREMGIRLALGANPAMVRNMVISSSMRLVLGGLAVGLAVALASMKVLTSFLYGVSATDPVTFGLVVALIGGTAFIASWLPAYLGTRVDPTITMRAE